MCVCFFFFPVFALLLLKNKKEEKEKCMATDTKSAYNRRGREERAKSARLIEKKKKVKVE